ncbi:MAG TPA: CopG family transcriptional regulator [Bdellovibrionota bacterium]|nr:CopG family transcriptional regulator [Bdellovibrionota bacterium]
MAKRDERRKRISLAELLRRSLRLLLTSKRTTPWMRYQGLVESGDPQSSQHIDEVIYGRKD